MQDAELIALVQAQDKEAISHLYDNYAAALYGVVLRIVHSPDIAQDVMQDSFVKVWRHGASYDASKGRLFTWLLNVARNTAIDAIRSADWKRSSKTDDISITVDFGFEATNPEHLDLQSLVNNLKPKYRTVINLFYFQSYTQQEIAEEFNIPLGTVKTRLRTAIIDLKKVFDKGNQQPNKTLQNQYFTEGVILENIIHSFEA